MSKKTMIQFCLLILIVFVSFFGFKITLAISSNANQVETFTEEDIEISLLQRQKMIKGKTAYALELCTKKINDKYDND